MTEYIMLIIAVGVVIEGIVYAVRQSRNTKQ